jgi:hypothetical protein
MAILASAFSWVRVTSGVWTRIAQGPLVQIGPIQALELVPTTFTSTVSITLDGYSAAPPFYERDFNTVDLSAIGPTNSLPFGSTGNWQMVVSYRISPFVEFWILLSRSCWAHMAVL